MDVGQDCHGPGGRRGAYRTALELLPQVTSWRADRLDHQYTLGRLLGLAADAAAAELECGRPAEALVRLEQGRGLLLDGLLAPRARFDELAEAAPDLATRLDAVLTELAGPPSVHQDRSALAHELDDVMATIRSLDGFARWGLPPLLADLVDAARPGPVVVLNVAAARSDALILTTAGLATLRLPELTLDEATARAAAMDDSALPDLLSWLWRTAVGPVLAHPALRPLLDQPTSPRLWWVPVGPLARLPVHAAGDALDLVVPSTAPTVTALLRSRRQPPIAEQRLAVVVADDVLDMTAIPAAKRAATVLAGRATALSGAAAATPPHGYSIVHYACHTINDLSDPSASRLVLGPNHQVTVAELARWQLRGAELAFLAACQTANTTAELADEAVHIAGGFLTAGFAQVVATLWPVNDSLAHRITKHFYAGKEDAAHALHRAVVAIRNHKIYGRHPEIWAAYQHLGR